MHTFFDRREPGSEGSCAWGCRSRSVPSPWGVLCLWLALVAGVALVSPSRANDLQLEFVGQSPANPVTPGAAIVYTLRTTNVYVGGDSSTIGVGIQVEVDGDVIAPAAGSFTTADCSEDQSFTNWWACNDLAEGQSQLVEFTWDTPDPGPSTVVFKGSCQLLPGGEPCSWPSVSTTTEVETPIIQFVSATFSAGETEGSVQITVERVGLASGAVSVGYGATGGSATGGVDYSLDAGTLTWADGDTSPRSFGVTIFDDFASEGDETVDLGLSSPSGAILGSPSQAVLTIVDNDQVVADFSFSPVSPLTGETVQFTDASTGSVVSRLWDFGDGATSNLQNPTHVYTAPGTYTVTLNVIADPGGSDSVQRTVVVEEEHQPAEPPAAWFTWSPTSPVPGQSVTFFDRSSGAIDSRLWSFGDGRSSLVVQPTHRYEQAGRYEATLTVSGPGGSSTVGREIVVGDQSILEFATGVVAVAEGVSELGVLVHRLGGHGTAEVTVALVGGSAELGVDFQFAEQHLRWLPGEDGPLEAIVTLFDDDEIEGVETLELALVEVSGAALGRRSTRIAVQDDDFELGPETIVGDRPFEGAQPSVAAFSPSGLDDFRRQRVIVWQAGDGDGGGIFATVLGSSGEVLVAPFRVNGRRSGDQHSPRVVFDGQGRWFVAWQQDPETRAGSVSRATGSSLWGQYFGLPAEEASEEVEIVVEGSPEGPAVATNGAGDVVVTWEDSGEILAQQLDEDGLAGTPVSLGTGERSQVARTGTGSYVILWQGPAGGATSTLSRQQGSSLFGQFHGTGGLPVSESQSIEEGGEEPSAAGGSSDEYVIAYTRRGPDGDRDVYAVVYGVDGSRKIERFQVNAVDAGDQRRPAVGVNASGDFAVAWESQEGVFARFYDRRARPVGGDVEVARSTPEARVARPTVSIDDADRVWVAWERRRPDGRSDGVRSRVVEPALSNGCEAGATALCLQDERFEIRVHWRTPRGESGEARAEKLTPDTGYFWFFRDSNVEMLIKVLDGCPLNQRYWVFAGGLTNVETEIVVTDGVTGESRRYRNPLGAEFQPIQDTAAFGGCDTPGQGRSSLGDRTGPARGDLVPESGRSAALVPRVGTCVDSDRVLCLGNGRFAVEASWATGSATDPAGTGAGVPVRLTEDTGYFWFFRDSNVEMVVKVLDACGVNRRYWVFAGGLTDVEVDWSVTDTVTGTTVEYHNEQGIPFQPVQDTDALPTCP